MRNYKICARCLMDTSDPGILFDEKGVCNLCTAFFRKEFDNTNLEINSLTLSAIFERIRLSGRKKRFDCIVGVSGGVDSSAVVRLAVENGLRVLAVHMDNGWNTPVAVQNISKIVEVFGIGYVSYVLPWDEFRRVQLAFLNASVPEVETPTDIAIQRAVHKFALKFNIKYILSGGNNASEGILPVAWHYNSRDLRYSYSILDAQGCSRRDFSKLSFSFSYEFYLKIVRSIKTIYPLNYIVYNKEVERAQLKRILGWQDYGVKHGESRFTRFIQTYYLSMKHGIDYRRATLSSELCAGRIGRAEALSMLSVPPHIDFNIDAEIRYVAKKLQIPSGELLKIVNAPPKWYFDYENNMTILGFAYDAYRLMHRKKKTSNF